MSQLLKFTKMSGAGNDFIVVDNRRGVVKNAAATARTLCRRQQSVGADGLLLVERSKKAELRMRIFNPDGSEAEMCGNGVRCVAKFAVVTGMAGPQHTIETLAGHIAVSVKGDIVKARMTDPKDLKLNLRLQVNGTQETLHFVNTGVPHAVVFEEALVEADVRGRGRAIRQHGHFAPKGTNVNFVALRGKNMLDVRTYERGVEADTLACGTGSTASALVAAALKGLESPVAVRTQGGETLKIYFSKEKNGSFRDVYLEGKVETTFEGSVKA